MQDKTKNFTLNFHEFLDKLVLNYSLEHLLTIFTN